MRYPMLVAFALIAAIPHGAPARTMASSEIELIPSLLPSVVNISFTKIVPGANGAPPRRTHGVGSGFIIGAAGEIVTNYHVVGGTSEIVVTLQDNTQLRAEIEAESPAAALAQTSRCRRSLWGIATSCRLASPWWPSATRWAWAVRSVRGS